MSPFSPDLVTRWLDRQPPLDELRRRLVASLAALVQVLQELFVVHHELLLIPPRLRRPALVCQVVQAAEEEALRASKRLAERIGRLQRLIRALENNHPPHPPAAGAWRHAA